MLGCGGRSTSISPRSTWAPAPKLTADAGTFKWATPTRLRGTLLADTWTYTQSFALPGGPATVVGILRVPGSTLPGFTARLMPDHHSSGFAGYAAVDLPGFWHLPVILAGEGALTDWFPYALPAGSYRLMIRQVGETQTPGTYDLWVAGVQ